MSTQDEYMKQRDISISRASAFQLLVCLDPRELAQALVGYELASKLGLDNWADVFLTRQVQNYHNQLCAAECRTGSK